MCLWERRSMHSHFHIHNETSRAGKPEAAVISLFFLLLLANCTPPEEAPPSSMETASSGLSGEIDPALDPAECNLVLSSPADGSVINDNTPTYSGTVHPNCTVEVIVNGTVLGNAFISATGNPRNWSLTQFPALRDDQHQVKARATDAINDPVESRSHTFTVDTSPP